MMDGQVPWRCLVPADAVAFIIGKGGGNIRQLCDTSGAEVAVSKEGETPATLADKIVTIGGLVEQKENACAQVLKRLRQMQGVNDHEPGVFVIIIPEISAPVIIGSKGAQIKSIMEQSGAEINVGREAIIGMRDQPISINGTAGQVVSAVSKLNGVLQDLTDRGKLSDRDFAYRPPDGDRGEAVDHRGLGPAADFQPSAPPARPAEAAEHRGAGPAAEPLWPAPGLAKPAEVVDYRGTGPGPEMRAAAPLARPAEAAPVVAKDPVVHETHEAVHAAPPMSQGIQGAAAGGSTGFVPNGQHSFGHGASAGAGETSFGGCGGAGQTSFGGSGGAGQTSFGGGGGAGQTSFGGGGGTGQTGFGGGGGAGQTSFGPNGAGAGVTSFGPNGANGGMTNFVNGSAGAGQTSFGACAGGPAGGQASFGACGQQSFGGQNGGMGMMGMGMGGMGGPMGMGGHMGMGGPMGFGPMGNPMMGGLGGMGNPMMGCMGMGNPMMGGMASNNERAFLTALQASGINSAQLTLLVPQALVQNVLVPRGFMAEIAQRSGAKIDLGGESPAGMRQVTLSGTMVANALASLFLQERVIQFQQLGQQMG